MLGSDDDEEGGLKQIISKDKSIKRISRANSKKDV